MAEVVMRNRVTSEYRKVQKDSEEFWELRAELHADGRPRWEQTGEHDLAAFQTRLENNQIRAEDVGDEHQPVSRAVGVGVGSEMGFGADKGWPTAGEIEQEAGRAASMSDDDLKQMAASYGLPSGTAADPGTGFPAGHPPEIPDEVAEDYGVDKTTAPQVRSDEVPEDKAETVRQANQEGDTEQSGQASGQRRTRRSDASKEKDTSEKSSEKASETTSS